MKVLLEKSKNLQMPIEIIYLSEKGFLTQRTIIVNEINERYIKAYCFSKQQIRIFKTGNILSAAIQRGKENLLSVFIGTEEITIQCEGMQKVLYKKKPWKSFHQRFQGFYN
ncbi:hypothetical protein [Metabacillus idriensis]|uniref:hypothetical protein n=1 Tax=Metabacillus idriensis TaxID=324768 RepID=UPI001CD59C63|nr:hypothetical protein [Metabacillus idriensis]